MKKVLLITNPTAGGAGGRLLEAASSALVGDFTLEVAETEGRDDATRLAREAVGNGIDALLAFGGDGTVNEIAQALVHGDVPLGIVPAGTTNVMARSIGMPEDVAEACALLAERIDSGKTRRINVGSIGDRFFLFGAGMGLDAEVIRAVEGDPEKKRRQRHLFFLQQAIATALRHRGASPAISMTVDGGEETKVVLALCANAGPFTYFGRHPVDVFPQVELEEGLDAFGLKRIGAGTIPRLAWSFFVSRSHVSWPVGTYHHDVRSVELRAAVPLPVEVDGDYIGEWDQATVSLIPHALQLLL
jgi:diacylglycerol kinase family enzyme